MLKKFFFFVLFLPIFAFADAPKEQRLLNRLWNDMKEGHVKAIKKYTCEDFQSLHFDGARNRCQELYLISNLHMQSYSLTNVVVTKGHNLLIFSYIATVQELIGGQPIVGSAPRLTIFEKVDGKWKWVSHASVAVPQPS